MRCSICGGELVPLGQLGSAEWYRCRNCGMVGGAEAACRHEQVKLNASGMGAECVLCGAAVSGRGEPVK